MQLILCEIVKPIAAMANRSRLRSSTVSDYELPVIGRKLWERAFSHAGSAAWNGLPTEIRSITDTNIFKSRLKTYLFNIAYDNWNSFVMRRWSQTADDSFVCSLVSMAQ